MSFEIDEIQEYLSHNFYYYFKIVLFIIYYLFEIHRH